MKAVKFLAIAVAAIVLAAPCHAAQTQSEADQSSILSALTSSNGTSAGSALLGLYTQYKTDGKLDLTNTKNISNLVTLATNIKGLKSTDTKSTVSNFVSGLITGSNSLVNNSNSTTVLNSLKKVANLDLSSLTSKENLTNTAKSAATSLLSGAVSKLAGSSTSTASTTTATTDSSTKKAANLLTSLFKAL